MANTICPSPDHYDFQLKNLYLVMTTVSKPVRWAQDHESLKRVMHIHGQLLSVHLPRKRKFYKKVADGESYFEIPD
uniref:Uncharacterized protein n=1 Tax=Romanomermis culicivorax TaxID=13658 RepID=A0A915L182_ROMCU